MAMREILFRGKSVDNGEWVEGLPSYDIYGDISEIEVHKGYLHCDVYEVYPETVCQYTGLTDKEGKKIFEGDIVKTGGNLVVQWNKKYASWCLSKKGWMYCHFFGEAVEAQYCEVIGNIVDNPDLLTTSSTDSD